EWQWALSIPAHAGQAGKHAERRKRPVANASSNVVVFVTTHAIQRVVMHHSHYPKPGSKQDLQHLRIRDVVQIDHIWLELFKRPAGEAARLFPWHLKA